MSITHAKIKWQCRRGMLELDYALNAFITQHIDMLNEADQEQLTQLLDYSDQDLYNWIFKGIPTSNQIFQTLIDQIRTVIW